MVNLFALAAASALLAPALGGGTPAGTGPARTYAWCQKKTRNPLEGCPKGTILVSKSSSKAKFSSIQDAILSLPNNTTPYTILIEPGNYTEQLNVTRSGPVTLLGVSDLPFQGKLYADIDSDTEHKNGVQVLWSAANHDNTGKSQDNYFSSVLTVAPNMNAGLTGSGPTGFPVPDDTPFGCSDFRAYNIDFRNVYSDRSDGPAHAVGVSRTNAGFYGCGFYSYQDTVYVGKLGNAYFYDSVAAGQTDFLYGFGTAFFEKSTLSLRNCGGGITAWKGTNTTFENKYGVYISDSRVIAANSTIAAVIKGRCPLGRPWNALHRSIFMASYLDASILPAGYIKWGSTDPRYTNTTVMAVWGDEGPGYNVTAMEAGEITIVMTDGEVGEYRWPKDVFITPEGEANNIWWIDRSVLAG